MINLSNWVIKTEGLSLKAGHRYLLKDIDWQVARGENWLVFGMNGSGKTTLLSILAGFKQGSSGRVEILGESYTSANILALRPGLAGSAVPFLSRSIAKNQCWILCSPANLAP